VASKPNVVVEINKVTSGF